MDNITAFNDKIEKLKKQKTKSQTQQAVLFMVEAEKIFGNSFSSELALALLSEWDTATESKKREWKTSQIPFAVPPFELLKEKLHYLSQPLTKMERHRQRKMDKLNVTSHEMRRARTRGLIQLGGLISKSGLLETFEISLGCDLQRDPEQKHQVAALFKGLVELNEMAKSDGVSLPLWSMQGLQLLGDTKEGR